MRTFTEDEVRDIITRVAHFSFDRGSVVARQSMTSGGRDRDPYEHHLYVDLAADMCVNVGLPREKE